MGYLDEALRRASVQSLREYFLYGVDGEGYSTKSYDIRLKKAYQEWTEIVKEYDEEGENSKLYRAASKVITEHEHVYMELGIQAGFQLAKEIGREEGDESQSVRYKEMYASLFQDVTEVVGKLQKAQKEAEEMYIS